MDIDEEELLDAISEFHPLETCLDGLTLVLSGEFQSVSRTKLDEFVRTHGGKCTSAVSGKTDYLVIGYKLEDGRDVT